MTTNRRTSTIGYPRGEDTRARVIAAALQLFGQHGFDGTSTREIAAAAKVNAPSLQYYFTSKEGLYLACIEHLAGRFWAHVGDAADDALELLRRRAPSQELIEAYCRIQERMADFMFSSTESSDGLSLVVREHAGFGPDAGFHLLYNTVSARLLAVNCAMVGRLTRRPAHAYDTRLRALTLNGQLMMFLFSRRTLLRALGWDGFRGKHAVRVKRMIRDNTENLLRAAIKARK